VVEFDNVVVFVLVLVIDELYVLVILFNIVGQEYLNFVVEVLEVMRVVVGKLLVLVVVFVVDLKLLVVQ
jgi:hypothetical protein